MSIARLRYAVRATSSFDRNDARPRAGSLSRTLPERSTSTLSTHSALSDSVPTSRYKLSGDHEIWESEIKDGIAEGNLLMFGHGFAIHFGEIEPPPGVDVGMVAPKGPGHLVRRQYEEGKGVTCLMAVHEDATGDARELVLAYASGIGGGTASAQRGMA